MKRTEQKKKKLSGKLFSVFATYLRCCRCYIRKAFVYFFHSRDMVFGSLYPLMFYDQAAAKHRGETLSSFLRIARSLTLFHPFWPIAKSNGTPRTQIKAAVNANQIHLLCISVHLVHSFCAMPCLAFAQKSCHCARCHGDFFPFFSISRLNEEKERNTSNYFLANRTIVK